MKLNNEWYDSLKYICTIFIPALCTLIGTIGNIMGYPEITGQLVSILSAFGLFIGTLVGISSIHYQHHHEEDNHNGYY